MAVAQALIGWAVTDRGPISAAEVLCEVRRRVRGSASRDKEPGGRHPLGDIDERVAYLCAGELQSLIGAVVEAVDGRKLDLEELRDQSAAMERGLDQAFRSAQLVHDGLTRPEDADVPSSWEPTPTEAQVWYELHQLEEIRRRSQMRDRAADVHGPTRKRTSWRVDGPRANGLFHAAREDGLALDGWAETPEAVPDVLRAWSIPEAPSAAITWAAEPARPARRQPCGLSYTPAVHEAWMAQLPQTLDRFAEAIDELRASWQPGCDVSVRLNEAAARLNREEPQALDLGSLMGGGDRNHGAPAVTRTTEWIDPAKVAHTGTLVWNDFGDHRPERPASLTRALLACTDPARTAEKWAVPKVPVRLRRVPGPAGPLYELNGDGTHRIHTARMLKFPLLWAVVTQYALPLEISWWDMAAAGVFSQEQESIVTSWRGLLDRGLLEGDLDQQKGVLRPFWVAAPWLLAKPQHAAAWAVNYERAYPGALSELGIPAAACQRADTWLNWIADRTRPGGPAYVHASRMTNGPAIQAGAKDKSVEIWVIQIRDRSRPDTSTRSACEDDGGTSGAEPTGAQPGMTLIFGVVHHPDLGTEPRAQAIETHGFWPEHLRESAIDALAETLAHQADQPLLDRIGEQWPTPYDPGRLAASATHIDGLQATIHRYALGEPADLLARTTEQPAPMPALAGEIAGNFSLPGDQLISDITVFLELVGAAISTATGHALAAAPMKALAEKLVHRTVEEAIKEEIRDLPRELARQHDADSPTRADGEREATEPAALVPGLHRVSADREAGHFARVEPTLEHRSPEPEPERDLGWELER